MEVTTMEDTWNMNGFGASPDGLGLSVGLADPQPVAMESDGFKRTLKVAYALAGMAGSAIGAYHGYKRNDSLGWAIGWAFLGGLFPVIVIPVAFAQGLGERKRGR
jgi:hypothetical protein